MQDACLSNAGHALKVTGNYRRISSVRFLLMRSSHQCSGKIRLETANQPFSLDRGIKGTGSDFGTRFLRPAARSPIH